MSISSNITEGPAPLQGAIAMAKEYKAAARLRRPTHPGALVKSDLEALNMSVNAAAIAIGVTRAALANLVNEAAAVSPEMALRLGKFFRNGPRLWIDMQTEVDLWDAAKKIGDQIEAIEPAEWDREEVEGG